ncbi:uroporphyrinogen decarboxylase family protein [Chloroflexota bacterium]
MSGIITTEQLLQENRKRADEILTSSGKTPEQLYEEREKRVRDAIQLREPDRVPVRLETHAFPARYVGVPIAANYYDPLLWKEATRKTVLDFEPDIYQGTVFANSGEALELLDPRHLAWPGGTLPPDVAHQNIEQEYLKEEEYDLFLSDPTDYTLRYLLPRAFGGLESLTGLPYLPDGFVRFPTITPLFSGIEMQKLAEALLKIGQAQSKAVAITADFSEEMAGLGFPEASHGGGAGGAPFDTISDFYRGMRGAMTDMFRCPDKLLALCDWILKRRLTAARSASPSKRGNPRRVFTALHRGAEGFMSREQFEKFYWPGLKQALLCTIEMDIVPIIFCEGHLDDRLEYFLELPKGKAVCLFEQTDMVRAKDVLKDHICIAGNVPSSLLQVGSPQDVEEYCADLIKVCGKGGGFILSAGSSIDEAKPANIKAMVEAPKKYSAG